MYDLVKPILLLSQQRSPLKKYAKEILALGIQIL